MHITDCHIHIQPVEMFKAGPLEVMKKARGHYEDILEYCRSPKALLKYLDSLGVERAVTAGATRRRPLSSNAKLYQPRR